MKPNVIDAIHALVPNAGFSYDANQITEWRTDGVAEPTKAEIDTKLVELEAEWTANEYQRDRATEYPAITDQLDEIYHNGIDSWKAVIKITKDKYPKG